MRAAFGPEAYLRLKRGRFACPSCFLADKDLLSLPGGLSCSTSFLNAAILGSALGLQGAEEAASLLDLLDRRGLCFITFFNLCVFLLMAREAGLPASAGYSDVTGGGYEGWGRLVEMIVAREGPGEVCSLGLGRPCSTTSDRTRAGWPRWSRDRTASTTRRSSGLGTMEFEQLVSPRGPTSASAGSPTYLPGQSPENMRRLTARMGAPEEAFDASTTAPGASMWGRLTRYSEDWYSLFSCLGVCNRAQINRLYNPEVFRRPVRSRQRHRDLAARADG